MAKVRKGATVVLKLDELQLWIRKQNIKTNQNKTANGQHKNGVNTESKQNEKNDSNDSTKERFKIVNRALDFNKLPPCRGKIIYMGIPKFLKQKKLVFGVQLYPPYFGLSQRVYKSVNTRKILGKISSKEFKAPLASIWFITENDIKGVMLRNTPRRMSKGATQMTNHLESPYVGHSHVSEPYNNLNLRSSSRSPRFDDEKKSDGIDPLTLNDTNTNNDKNSFNHLRRKSSFSLSCHYRNIDSLHNVSNLDAMFWEDTNLPSDYTLGKTKQITNTGIVRQMEEDPKERRFKLERWLYPIFLDFHDETTVEIVKDRCQWELTQWIRDEGEGVRTPMLRQFYDYMISLSENLDALFLSNCQKYNIGGQSNHGDQEEASSSSEDDEDALNQHHHNDEEDDSEDELAAYRASRRAKKLAKLKRKQAAQQSSQQQELWQLDELNFQFEMMSRIKELTECVEDALEAMFVLRVIDALDNDVFFASPILQCIVKHIGNDIKFMVVLRENCQDAEKCMDILSSMERFSRKGSILPVVWKLIELTNGNELMVEEILVSTNNIQERDVEVLSVGLLNVFRNDDIDSNIGLLISVWDLITLWFNKLDNDENAYMYNHIREVLLMVNEERTTHGDNHQAHKIQYDEMIKYAILSPLVSPYELRLFWREHRSKNEVEQLNILSSLQIKYEQYQLFLGRYLLYCPFKTKSVHTVKDGKRKYDDYKNDQDEVEFYGEDDDADTHEDATALLFEVTIDIDNVSKRGNRHKVQQQFTRRCCIKKCLCVKNLDSFEYEPEHYYEDELVFSWEVLKYTKNEKILKIHNTPCQWIPNLKNVNKINPSYQIEYNPEDLHNELRGYLVFLPDDDGKLSFMEDLFKTWNDSNKNGQNSKYVEAAHKMQERPLFASMEKWKLMDSV